MKKEKLEEGKLFLQEVILNRQKENYRFTDTWNFVRGPDINGVNLIEPDYYLLSKKNYLDIKNEIIKNNYAELLETCFSCAPRGQPWKIRWDHVDHVLVQRKTDFSILKNKLSRYRAINLKNCFCFY